MNLNLNQTNYVRFIKILIRYFQKWYLAFSKDKRTKMVNTRKCITHLDQSTAVESLTLPKMDISKDLPFYGMDMEVKTNHLLWFKMVAIGSSSANKMGNT
jgi:hypothetical protein